MYRLRISIILLALAGIMLLGSCQKDPFDNGKEYNYSTFAIGTEGSRQMALTNLSGEIMSIDCSASWLKASECGQSANGHPMITITNSDGKGDKATITVTDKNRNKPVITVQHQPLDDGDAVSGSNDDFMQNWWNFVNIPLEGFDVPQKAPWTA